ncbi:MAG: hypothetical protein IRZ00_04135, partial [Gemmatimonadetes bacterium]|nr:hypothetical protein [Gemmatimonadota bacterium]
GLGPAPVPTAGDVERMIDVAFWASLRREEGYSPKISLVFLPPEQTTRPLLFEHRLTLTPAVLGRLAPAVERPGIHLGVWRDAGDLQVWGTTRTIPCFTFVLEVIQPGLVVVKYRRAEEYAKFGNVAVLEGDEVKLVDERAASLPDCPQLLTSLLGFDSPASWVASTNVLVQLAVSMRAHGRGGTLLVVPDGSEAWRESILRPIPYPVMPPFSELADLLRRGPAERRRLERQEAVLRAVDAIAGLTAVDGATVVTDSYRVLAFGAKIARRRGSAPVARVVATAPVVGDVATVVAPATIGGTRHLSAAQFIHDQRDALALVASQDGRFTLFAWSPCEDMVHAHRVEVLLL